MVTINLLHLRTQAALSQRDLAKLAGVSTATIVKAEKGQDVFPSTVRKLAAALGVAPRELLDGGPR
ncbi:MAG TPA: helix-turn-helix transcriptional regulator [Acidimicrobiales bacterium]